MEMQNFIISIFLYALALAAEQSKRQMPKQTKKIWKL